MEQLTQSPQRSLAAGLVLAGLVLIVYFAVGGRIDTGLLMFLVRWLHVFAGMVWVGLIWFVNFVQLPALAAVDDAGRAVLGRHVVANVALWFRHAATVTVLAGLVLAALDGVLIPALSLGASEGFAAPRSIVLGLGIWAAIAMLAFVHGVIWPNLKLVLGLEPADAQAIAAARLKVRTYARANLILAVPVVVAMMAARHLL